MGASRKSIIWALKFVQEKSDRIREVVRKCGWMRLVDVKRNVLDLVERVRTGLEHARTRKQVSVQSSPSNHRSLVADRRQYSLLECVLVNGKE